MYLLLNETCFLSSLLDVSASCLHGFLNKRVAAKQHDTTLVSEVARMTTLRRMKELVDLPQWGRESGPKQMLLEADEAKPAHVTHQLSSWKNPLTLWYGSKTSG